MRSALASSRRVRKRCATQQCDFKLPRVTLNDTVFFFFFLSFLYLFLTSLTNNDQTGDPLTLHDFSRILLLLFFFVHQGFFVPRIDLRHTRSFSESRERCFSFAQVELFSNKREFWCSCISTDNRRELRIFQINLSASISFFLIQFLIKFSLSILILINIELISIISKKLLYIWFKRSTLMIHLMLILKNNL